PSLQRFGLVQLAPERRLRPLGDAGVGHHLADVCAVFEEAHERLGVGPFVDDEDFTAGLVRVEPVVDAPGVSSALPDSFEPLWVAVQSLLDSCWIACDPQPHQYRHLVSFGPRSVSKTIRSATRTRVKWARHQWP